MSLAALGIDTLQARLVDGDFTSAELFADCRAAAERWGSLNAFVHLEDAPHTTGAGPLSGIPFALKDNIVVSQRPVRCSSRVLENFHPPYDATAYARLRAGGAVLLGQTNMDEFGMGSSTENSIHGPTRNPWNLEKTAGGSSGGSAAAVAAGIVPFALGSDTGGSIRQPAGFCGCVGLKPSYGRVSRYGLVAFASSLDVVGPITRNVLDAATVLECIAGVDPLDATSRNQPVGDLKSEIETGAGGLRIAVPTNLLATGVDPEVRQNFESTLEALESAGADLVEVELSGTSYACATYYILATAEASSNLARYDGVRYGRRAEADDLETMYRRTRTEGFGEEVKLRILLGTYVLSAGYYDAYYRRAERVRVRLAAELAGALESCAVLALPTSPTPAFGLGERTDDPLQMYLSDIFTVLANLAGVPAISLPTGLTSDGLPLSMQFIGHDGDEATLLRAARACEHAVGFEQLRDDRFPPGEPGS